MNFNLGVNLDSIIILEKTVEQEPETPEEPVEEE